MRSPGKSMDQFEFNPEDEVYPMAVKKASVKIEHPSTSDIPEIETQSKDNETELHIGTDFTSGNYNDDATAGSSKLIEPEGFAEMSAWSYVLRNGFKSHEQAADIKSNITESGSVFVSMDISAHLTSNLDETISEGSPAIATSSDGLPSPNCFSGWNLEGESARVVFYPDYLEYRGTHYADSAVWFSRSSIEAGSKTTCERERMVHIRLDVEDIVKIESQWSARFETGTICISFIAKGSGEESEDHIVHHDSGTEELKFPIVDSDWYEKLEAIESLDLRYKSHWTVLLDIGNENCSSLLDGDVPMLTRSYFPDFRKPFEELIYPNGDPDAVSISKRDVDLLLPDTFVNDTIIDFYIKYLKTRQIVEARTKFHFFNSFFFRKLADMDKDPSSAFDGNAAFKRVRKWTRKVDLLEKDFIFIPVNYNYHWSLIVICYFGEVANYKDDEDKKLVRVPCILHMDSLRGNHVGLKDLIQSYLWEEWQERQKETCEDMHSKFRNIKFIPLELPQQQNSYDCGLFLLHYVERFLEEVLDNFNIYKITPSSKFLQEDWFPPGEASLKRTHIQILISGLLNSRSENCSPGGSSQHDSPECPSNAHGYEDGVEFSVKSGSWSGYPENSLCQVGQGIEMTLLPNSSVRNTHSTRDSGLVLKELFEQSSASESLNNASWKIPEGGASLHEFKQPVPPTEMENGECFVSIEIAEPVFPQLDGVTSEAQIFPSSEDIRLEPVHKPTPGVAASSAVTSGEPHDSMEPIRRQVVINDQGVGSFFLKTVHDFCRDINQPQTSHSSPDGNLPISAAAFVSGDEFGVPNPENPNLMVRSCDLAELPHSLTSTLIGHKSASELSEQPAVKRMRITPQDGWEEPAGGSISEDLHL